MPSKVEDACNAHLFHYTNPRGSDGICRERVIRVTSAGSRFAWFGEGVYMTALSPSFGRDHLLYNNHHKTHTRDRNLWAKTSIYFKIHSMYLPGVRKVVDRYDRDIYVCPNNIDLNYVPYETGLSDKYRERITFARPQTRCSKRTVASYYAAPDAPIEYDDLSAGLEDTMYGVRPISVVSSYSGAPKTFGSTLETYQKPLAAPQKPLEAPKKPLSAPQRPVRTHRASLSKPGTLITVPETVILVPGTTTTTTVLDAGEKMKKKKKKKSCCGQCCIS